MLGAAGREENNLLFKSYLFGESLIQFLQKELPYYSDVSLCPYLFNSYLMHFFIACDCDYLQRLLLRNTEYVEYGMLHQDKIFPSFRPFQKVDEM